jgi:adenine-specific DNA-methyltransferase
MKCLEQTTRDLRLISRQRLVLPLISLAGATDHLLWYFKTRSHAKFRRVFNRKNPGEEGATQFTLVQSPDASIVRRFAEAQDENLLAAGWRRLAHDNLTSTGFASTTNY